MSLRASRPCSFFIFIFLSFSYFHCFPFKSIYLLTIYPLMCPRSRRSGFFFFSGFLFWKSLVDLLLFSISPDFPFSLIVAYDGEVIFPTF